MAYTKMKCKISTIHVMNNYALVKFIDDDIQKNPIIVIAKRNNSTKLRSNYVGLIIDRPDEVYGNADQSVIIPLNNLIKNETIVSYDPRSIQVEITDEDTDEIYHLIRSEDIFCILEDYQKEDAS